MAELEQAARHVGGACAGVFVLGATSRGGPLECAAGYVGGAARREGDLGGNAQSSAGDVQRAAVRRCAAEGEGPAVEICGCAAVDGEGGWRE